MRVNELFAPTIFPNFPFLEKNWTAIAFDRGNYDFLRCPPDLIKAIYKVFGPCSVFVHGFGGQFDQVSEFSTQIIFEHASRFRGTPPPVPFAEGLDEADFSGEELVTLPLLPIGAKSRSGNCTSMR